MPQNPNNQLPLGGGPRRSPEGFAGMIGSYVMAFVRLTFWTVVAAAALAAGWVALKGIWVVSHMLMRALGV